MDINYNHQIIRSIKLNVSSLTKSHVSNYNVKKKLLVSHRILIYCCQKFQFSDSFFQCKISNNDVFNTFLFFRHKFVVIHRISNTSTQQRARTLIEDYLIVSCIEAVQVRLLFNNSVNKFPSSVVSYRDILHLILCTQEPHYRFRTGKQVHKVTMETILSETIEKSLLIWHIQSICDSTNMQNLRKIAFFRTIAFWFVMVVTTIMNHQCRCM